MAHARKYLLLLLVHIMLSCAISAFAQSEAQTLLKFKESLSNATALSNWDESISLCSGNGSNWRGLLCSDHVFYGLQLESMGLGGTIDVEALSELPHLRTVNFMNNGFEGQMPEVKKLGGGLLRAVLLSNNRFSGKIAGDAFAGMTALRYVYLANNEFGGEVPMSLAELPKLADLLLEGNQFEGKIPDFLSTDLRMVNLANNRLEGPIPASLSNFSPSSFSGMFLIAVLLFSDFEYH